MFVASLLANVIRLGHTYLVVGIGSARKGAVMADEVREHGGLCEHCASYAGEVSCNYCGGWYLVGGWLDQIAELLRARIGNDGTAEADTLADIADIVRASGRDLGGVA